MTIKNVSSGVSRAQALRLPLRYATTRTSEAKLTAKADGTYTLSVTVPLSDVKPAQLNSRILKGLQNGFTPSLKLPAATTPLATESVKVSVTGSELRLEATFKGQPSELSGWLKEMKALDLSFTHPRGMPEFRVDLQLAELQLDRTAPERALLEKATGEAKANLSSWKSDFETARSKVPTEAAALEAERKVAAQALAEAEASVARARTAIDKRSDSVPATQLATLLRGRGVPEGKAWLDTYVALGGAKADLSKAEALEKERAEVAQQGVDPDELGPRPDVAAARARVTELEAKLEGAERDVRTAFKNNPDVYAHLALASVTGNADDRAASDALRNAVLRLYETTNAALEVAVRKVSDPNVLYPRVIAAAEAEVRRLEEAQATLKPVVATLELEQRGADDAQRALFGVPDDQSWVDWRKDMLARPR